MKQEAVLSILITVLLAVPAVFLSGCATGQVVPPFNPQPVKPAPYNPEPEWNDRTDVNLLALQQIKQKTGQTMPPGGTAATTTGGTTTSGTTGGTTGGVTPVPGPAPGPTPTPSRVWSPTDPVWGYVLDRLTGVPISGATVRLLNSLGSTLQTYTTSGDGGFSFKFSTAGYYKIDTVAGGYATIPPSSYNFYYGTTNLPQHNLELLSTGMPHLTLRGQTSFVKPTGYASLTTEPVASQQPTYAGILFEAPSGLVTDFYNDGDIGDYTTYAEYWFSVPVPATYSIGYDSFWVISEQYGPSSGNNWVTLTQDKVERQFYDWDDLMQQGDPHGWASIDRDGAGAFSSSATGYVPFWAIKRTTDVNGNAGTVLMRICPRDPTVFVASVTLYYGFHEITMAPFINRCQSNALSPPAPNDSTYLEVNENVYATASFATNTMPTYAGIAVIPWNLGISWYQFNNAPGGNYTITVTDQAGHSTTTGSIAP